ncbi:MAG TPA: acyltransferase [Tepidisphaeraceae bacterium]|jgi:peptidoglycan/LPS O-acetylase OafA/YrhL|nr:acyltransferase [Tepidisphaeraceae bacterium]
MMTRPRSIIDREMKQEAPLIQASRLAGGRIPSLDGLRAIAIAGVIFTHAMAKTNYSRYWIPYITGVAGTLGVQIFFGISGFLITILLFRERMRTGSISIRGFYLRRILRIIPAYVGYLAAIAGLAMAGLLNIRWQEWAYVLTYTTNWAYKDVQWVLGHTWTLSLEEQFYLFWPSLFLWISGRQLRRLLVGYLVAAPLFRLAAKIAFPDYFLLRYTSAPACMDSMAVGCLLAMAVFHGIHAKGWLERLRKAPNLTFLASAIVLCSSLVAGLIAPPYMLLIGRTIDALAIGSLIWAAVNLQHGMLFRMLNSKPFAAVGILSYSLYLWQQLFLFPNCTWLVCRPPWSILLAMVAAIASYFIIEMPFLRLKDRLGSRRHGST